MNIDNDSTMLFVRDNDDLFIIKNIIIIIKDKIIERSLVLG